MATRLATTMSNSLKGRPVQVLKCVFLQIRNVTLKLCKIIVFILLSGSHI